MDAVRILLSSLLIVCILPLSTLSLEEEVTITVEGGTPIAQTDDPFVCATLDWWPPIKCNYDQCPWGNASILNLDLSNPILLNAIKAFSPLRIRLGGTLQDLVLYNVNNYIPKCPHFKRRPKQMFGFSAGCLEMNRWDQLNDLLSKSGAVVTFGLNALNGRRKASDKDNLFVGNWRSNNAHNLISYTISKGYNIDSWELGNELCGGGIGARVEANQYAKDVIVLKQILKELYQNSSSKPKLLAPGGFYDSKWFSEFLRTSGSNVVDVVTHHTYNLGAGNDPNILKRMQDPFYLDGVANTYKQVKDTINTSGPWSSAWVGEAGGAYNSGGKYVSHTFVDGFWYLDQLGMTSKFNHKVFCRQTLIGGNYGLLNTTTFIPNPDYYGALLWHRLMGIKVLGTSHKGSPYLRAYAHCAKDKLGITLLLINLSNSTSFQVSVFNDRTLEPFGQNPVREQPGKDHREEYHLTPKDGNIQSDVVLLNGSPLLLLPGGEIPEMKPELVDTDSPIAVVPQSIVFAHLANFRASACQ